jgi:hypothetical protein
MIFDELEIGDTLGLTAVAVRFWKMGWPHMEKKLVGFIGPWAGHRLVCLGDYVKEYPPDMESEDEKQEIAAGLHADDFPEGERKPHPEDPVDLSVIAHWRYKRTYGGIPLPHVINYLERIAMDEMYNMPGPLTTRVFRFTRARHLSKYYPKEQKWVLRNLTTREFVRAGAVAGNSEQNGPYIEYLGFFGLSHH